MLTASSPTCGQLLHTDQDHLGARRRGTGGSNDDPGADCCNDALRFPPSHRHVLGEVGTGDLPENHRCRNPELVLAKI